LTARGTPGRRVVAVDRSRADPDHVKVGDALETMFLEYMVQVMRSTVPESETGLHSPATRIYQSMLDSETAQSAARVGGIGLSDQIVAWLESTRYTGPREQAAPAAHAPVTPSTGGTHEDQPTRK
jgi:Rod binding domain-containing protein